MDTEIDRKQRDQEALDARNKNLLRDLEMFRDKEVKYTKTLNALDEQT